MERITFIVQRLNGPPFRKGFNTLSELDTKSSLELLDLVCEILVNIDRDQEGIFKESTDFKIERIIKFLMLMKFSAVSEDQLEEFQVLLNQGDTDVLHTIMHWLLERFEHLQKRAYLAKFLMPVDIPAEFMGDDLIIQLSNNIKQLQTEFKEVHKTVDQMRGTSSRPAELKTEITQLEQERIQLTNKINKLKKDTSGNRDDEEYFQEMLKATSEMRKEQEEEIRMHERLRENRRTLSDVDMRLQESNKKLSDMRSSGIQSQSAEQLLAKLNKEVKELTDRKESIEISYLERENHLIKLQEWDKADRVTTEDDVRAKRDQVHDMQEQNAAMQERLDAALERNTKLTVFRQASTMAMKKLREKDDDLERHFEEKRRIQKVLEDKEDELRAAGKLQVSKKMDLKKYGAIIRDKIEKYKKMREELSAVRAELVILQRTEQILKSKHKNIDEFLLELEAKNGVKGYRETQKQLVEMSERTALVDQMKGETLEQISQMVEVISREFKAKQSQLQPIMHELKQARQEYLDLEAEYMERKTVYDKVAVGLEMEKQSLEQDCDTFQDECLREESRYHYLNSLIAILRIKTERADQEKKWQNGDGKMMRDFNSMKELYANKLTQQEQLIKTLRKKQKELKENSGIMTNQKSNFLNLQTLLNAKIANAGAPGNASTLGGSFNYNDSQNFSGGANVMTIDSDYK